MNKLLAISILIFSLIVSPSFAIEYCKDVLEPGNPGGSNSLKTWDDEWTISGADEFSIAFWINDVPESLLTAGLLIEYDPAKMSVVSTEINDLWDTSMSNIIQDPQGLPPGTVLVTTGNFSLVAPDSEGDISVANIRFNCFEDCEGEITVSIIPNFDSVVGNSAIVYDSQIDPNTFTIEQGIPTTTTTSTTKDNICVPETIYGEHSTETELLRSFRDNVLSKTHEGQELIKFYYQWSPVVVQTMEADEKFKKEIKDMIDEMLPMMYQ